MNDDDQGAVDVEHVEEVADGAEEQGVSDRAAGALAPLLVNTATAAAAALNPALAPVAILSPLVTGVLEGFWGEGAAHEAEQIAENAKQDVGVVLQAVRRPHNGVLIEVYDQDSSVNLRRMKQEFREGAAIPPTGVEFTLSSYGRAVIALTK